MVFCLDSDGPMLGASRVAASLIGSQHCEDVMTIQVRGISDPGHNVFTPQVHHAVWAREQGAKRLMRVSLFDGITLHIDDREVALISRKAKALIAYLLLTPGMKDTRDRLVGLFWSETENAKARASLRQLLLVVREVLDKDGLVGLVSDKFHVSLDASVFATDLDHALASIERGDPVDSLLYETRITDSFLRGYDDIDPSFGSWLTIKRETICQAIVGRLEAQLADTAHQTEAAKRIARALLQIDPTHEIACQALMHAYIALGNIGGALAAYKQLWECLEREYDIEPSTATQELVVAIKSGKYSPPAKGFGSRNAKNVAARVEKVNSATRGVACSRLNGHVWTR
jgi:DNA-binding SARP family transcriptional activator